MYYGLMPHGLVPEEHGWTVANPIAPHQQLPTTMMELHRFGFVSTHWMRWQPPFTYPAGLAFLDYHQPTGRYIGLYSPPFECPDRKVTASDVFEEIFHGVRSTVGVGKRESVSRAP